MNRELAVLWRKRLDDWSVSSLSLTNWCEAHGVTFTQYYYWKRILGQESAETTDPQNGRWLAVDVMEAEPLPNTSGAVKVRVAGLTLEIEAGFHPATLRAVIEALGAQPC
jgi:hypothetical protein